jgi:peptidoglycan/LPS O-acetylase OafA/YrhL
VLFGLGILPLISRMQFSANFYDPLKYFIFSIFAIPFFRYCLQLPPAGKKIKMIYLIIPHTIFVIAALTIRYMPLKNAIIYSTFPYVYMGIGYVIELLKIKEWLKNFISKSGAIMGKYSYSLYISHYTILFIFSKLIHNVLLYALVSLPIILVIAYGLESWLQPAVMRLYKSRKQSDVAVKEDDLHLLVKHSAPVQEVSA